jgi:predicted CopG family antitoxin
MIQLTYHIQQRYVQRIMNIQNEEEARYYLAVNNADVIKKVYELFRASRFIGRAPYEKTNNTICDFYITDEHVLLIVEHHTQTAVTLYPVKIKEKTIENSDEINRYLKQIAISDNRYGELNRIKESTDLLSRNIEYAIERKKAELETLEDELNKSIELSKSIKWEMTEAKRKSKDCLNRLRWGMN